MKRIVIMISTTAKLLEPEKSSGLRLVGRRRPADNTSLRARRLLVVMMNLLFTSWSLGQWTDLLPCAEAVSVQKLNVPDLVVIDQLNQQQTRSPHAINQEQLLRFGGGGGTGSLPTTAVSSSASGSSQPEAASLINSQHQENDPQQITFECLISFDKRKDRNLIVKWHHDDRIEPIYQWIPELNKRFIAPQYRAYIAPIGSTNQQHDLLGANSNQNATSNQIQLLEAGFKLVRPSKELGGKYTCSAISSQNDDSKWKKMIVYTPPRVFRFNASRTDIGALLANQRERLIHPSMIGSVVPTLPALSNPNNNFQLPLAYRMKGFEHSTTTISPQMYSTIDYVNVNQQRARQSSLSQSTSSWVVGPPTSFPNPTQVLADRHKPDPSGQSNGKQNSKQMNGVKLVCDIDQVFPVPEVSIYKLAKLDGSHPDKLAKLDTRVERHPITGLYHVQVISVLDDDELQMKYGYNEPVYFECLIALTNLELSKYADNKRSIVYRPGHLTNSSLQADQTSEDINSDQVGSSASKSGISNHEFICVFNFFLALSSTCYLAFLRPLMMMRHQRSQHFTRNALISQQVDPAI